MNTSVLCSSIFFIADSVFKGLAVHKTYINTSPYITKERKNARDDRPEFIHAGNMVNTLPLVLRVPGQAEGLWSVEGDGVADLARVVTVHALESRLLRGLGLRVLRRRGGLCSYRSKSASPMSASREMVRTVDDGRIRTLGGVLALRALSGDHFEISARRTVSTQSKQAAQPSQSNALVPTTQRAVHSPTHIPSPSTDRPTPSEPKVSHPSSTHSIQPLIPSQTLPESLQDSITPRTSESLLTLRINGSGGFVGLARRRRARDSAMREWLSQCVGTVLGFCRCCLITITPAVFGNEFAKIFPTLYIEL